MAPWEIWFRSEFFAMRDLMTLWLRPFHWGLVSW